MDIYHNHLIKLIFTEVLRKISIFQLFLLVFGLFGAESREVSASASVTVSSIDWLAYGDLRGYIEPCGCDPTTDLGGVDRIAKLILRDKSLSKNTLVFDLGNHTLNLEKDPLKKKYILKAIDFINPDVSLLNRVELAQRINERSSRKFVLSNLKETSEKLYSAKIKGAIIFGFLSPELTTTESVSEKNIESLLLGFTPKLEKNWKELANQFSGDKKILLFSGSTVDLKKIANSNIFDLIVSSNSAPLTAEVGNKERYSPGLLLRISEPTEVYQTPIGGQGVLRGGKLRESSGNSISELASLGRSESWGFSDKRKDSESNSIMEKLSQLKNETLVTWLGTEFGEASPLDKLMSEYGKARSEDFDSKSEKRVADLKNSKFAGSVSCKSCHEKAWLVWSSSNHSKSYPTLVKKGKEKDSECVGCHVLGLTEIGGFVSLEKSPEFASVQCENCHGPAKEHVNNPMLKPKLTAMDACKSCHHSPHSTNFDFDHYWQKIKH